MGRSTSAARRARRSCQERVPKVRRRRRHAVPLRDHRQHVQGVCQVQEYQAVPGCEDPLPKSKKFKKLMKKFKKDGGTMTPWKLISFAQLHARDGTCTKVKPG